MGIWREENAFDAHASYFRVDRSCRSKILLKHLGVQRRRCIGISNVNAAPVRATFAAAARSCRVCDPLMSVPRWHGRQVVKELVHRHVKGGAAARDKDVREQIDEQQTGFVADGRTKRVGA